MKKKKNSSEVSNLFVSNFLNRNLKYILLIIILNYFLFQIYLNNFVNTSGVGYFDFFCFSIYFILIYFTIFFINKSENSPKEYFYNVFCVILIFSILNVLFLKIINLFGLIKINFNIIFSLTNPFYFLKIYSPLDKPFSIELIFEMFSLFFNQFNFNLLYLLLLLIIFLLSLKNFLRRQENNTNKDYLYIILFSLIIFFLILLNNFRYNVSYNIYILPFLLLSISISLKNIKRKFFYITVISTLFLLNFTLNINSYKTYIYKPSNLNHVCTNKSTRDFYFHWARNFDENFFKKICVNNNIIFK